MKHHALAGLCVVIGLLNGKAHAAAETDATAKADSITHAPSGFVFPEKIGNVERLGTQFHTYNAEGTDVSIGYNGTTLPIAITVYVYPSAGLLLASEFQNKEQEVQQHYADTHLDSTADIELTSRHIHALSATYHYHGNFAGQYQLLSSRLIVGQSGPFFVEYRITFPATLQAFAEVESINFTSTLDWPAP